MYKKIVIFGRPGSGKSTFCSKLAKKMGLPLFHLDKIYFAKDWTKRDNQAYLDDLHAIVQQDEWIIDGNCLRSLDVRWQQADLVIHFNFPFYLCLWRLIKRLWAKDCTIDDRAPGCYEAVRWDLVTYTWRWNWRVKDLIPELQKHYPHVPYLTVKSSKEVTQLFKTIE